jgi:hypothetical protein
VGIAPRCGADYRESAMSAVAVKKRYRKPRLVRLGLLRRLTRFSF